MTWLKVPTSRPFVGRMTNIVSYDVPKEEKAVEMLKVHA